MKVLLINGSPHEKGCTYTALDEVSKILQKENIGTDIFGSAIRQYMDAWVVISVQNYINVYLMTE